MLSCFCFDYKLPSYFASGSPKIRLIIVEHQPVRGNGLSVSPLPFVSSSLRRQRQRKTKKWKIEGKLREKEGERGKKEEEEVKSKATEKQMWFTEAALAHSWRQRPESMSD